MDPGRLRNLPSVIVLRRRKMEARSAGTALQAARIPWFLAHMPANFFGKLEYLVAFMLTLSMACSAARRQLRSRTSNQCRDGGSRTSAKTEAGKAA